MPGASSERAKRRLACLLAGAALAWSTGCATTARLVLRPGDDPIPAVTPLRGEGGVVFLLPTEADGVGGSPDKQRLLGILFAVSAWGPLLSLMLLSWTSPLVAGVAAWLAATDAIIYAFMGDIRPVTATLELAGSRFVVARATPTVASTGTFPVPRGILGIPLTLRTYDLRGNVTLDQPVVLPAKTWSDLALAVEERSPALRRAGRIEVRSLGGGGLRTLSVAVPVQNAGARALRNVRCTWVSGDPAVTVRQGAGFMTEWAAGETRTFRAEVEIDQELFGLPVLPLYAVFQTDSPEEVTVLHPVIEVP